jgi:hypothetical protein
MALCGGSALRTAPAHGRDDSRRIKPKSVAAVFTAYQKGLHAEVLVGKILEGWNQDGGLGPALKLVSMYVDQFPAKDLARPMAAKYDVPIFDTIEEALTVGGDSLAIDGVISIGEHGSYPSNAKGQHLYPRRRFFEEITDTFAKYDRVVPVYGSHTLDCFQGLIERRRDAEKGVTSVQCLQGQAMWKAIDDGAVRKDVLDAALSVVPKKKNAEMRKGGDSALFLFQYADGLPGAVLMLPQFVGGISAGLKIKGQRRAIATRFEERPHPHHPHFSYLLKSIERMMHTGQPSYPVERTLLTSGILDRGLTSRVRGYKKLMTPELAIRYQPVDYPHAPHPKLESDPTLR